MLIRVTVNTIKWNYFYRLANTKHSIHFYYSARTEDWGDLSKHNFLFLQSPSKRQVLLNTRVQPGWSASDGSSSSDRMASTPRTVDCSLEGCLGSLSYPAPLLHQESNPDVSCRRRGK